jgi:hypothetical protein
MSGADPLPASAIANTTLYTLALLLCATALTRWKRWALRWLSGVDERPG